MAESSLSGWRDKAERLQSQMRNLREQTKHATRVGTESLIVIAGGAAAGAIQNKIPFLPGTQIPTAAAVGVGLVTMAMSGMLDDQGDNAAFLGAGMLAALAAVETNKLLSA